MLKPEQIRTLLKAGAVNVEFFKADGSRRKMTATTDMETVRRLAPNKVPVADPARPARVDPPGLFTVFDINERDWRRFKYDTLISVEGAQ